MVIAWSKINSPLYENIVCSISGGSDSDIMLDIVWRCDKDNKVTYVWYDTGLEYQAIKKHLMFLENKYGIEIKPYKAIKPIPVSCNQYGQPFLSKQVSAFISRLQRHNFQWEDKSLDELLVKYPHCKSALMWWTNDENKPKRNRISQNKYLKEFLISNPPNFKISDKCCTYAKKKISHKLLKENNIDLNVLGIRKAEGGVRTSAYKSCFDENSGDADNYRPLFWYKDSDKLDYEKCFGVTHSDCYTEYGLKRTGCAGCPFGRNFEHELAVIEAYEPNLYKAVNNIFADSYEYTRKYREFAKMMKEKEKI